MRKSVIIKLLLFLIIISFLYINYASAENKGNAITWIRPLAEAMRIWGFLLFKLKMEDMQ